MSKAKTLATTVSTGGVLADGTVAAAEVSGLAAVATSGNYSDLTGTPTLPTGGDIVGTTATQTLTNKTLTDPILTLGAGQGTAGQVPVSQGAGLPPVWSAAASANFQEFTASGNWTKPADAKFVLVEAWGAGGGGGSGRRGAAAAFRGGGGGGGGGAYAQRFFTASAVPGTVSVVIGAGGAGAAAITANDTNGSGGTFGGSTSFGSLLTAFGGSGGQGGGSVTGTVSAGGGVLGVGAPAARMVGSEGQPGHFGSATVGSNPYGSGWGGGVGGAPGNLNAGGGSSFQGGPGGGQGAVISQSDVFETSGAGGGITGEASTGAPGVAYLGASGVSGVGRQGASGGAPGGSIATTNVLSNTLCYGNSTFACVVQPGYIATSANGTTGWQFRSPPAAIRVSQLLHDGTQFVVFNSNGTRCWTTTDFATYTERTGLSTGITVGRVKYVNGNYFVMGHSGSSPNQVAALWRSTDLVSWSQVNSGNGSSGTSTQLTDICWTGTNYLAVSIGNSPYARYSSDLTNWSTPTGITGQIVACESNGAGTVVIIDETTPFAKRSTNHGLTFSNVATTLSLASVFTANSIAYVNSTWLLATANSLWSSTDGNTYTQRINAIGNEMGGGIAFDGTTYVVGSSTIGSSTVARTATVLTTWTDRTIAALNTNGGVGGTGGVASGGGGGGASVNGFNSGAGGAGGNGLLRVYTW